MTARLAAGPLALLAALAIVVAACGSGTATQAPVTAGPTQPAATQPAATTTTTQGPAATGAEPSFDLSSFHGDTDLESLFPKEIDGKPLIVLSMTGDQFMGQGSSPELDAALSALGKSTSDLSVAFGGVSNVTIVAFKISGVPGSAILNALFTAYQNQSGTITDMTISGKSVKKVVPADATEGTSYIYAVQDVVFAVGGDGITDAQLNEAFSKLP